MKYYVTMTDKFLSFWGMSKGKINKLIFECDSYEQAKDVKRNAEIRKDFAYVNICINKPKYDESKYFTHYKTREDFPNFFIPRI